MLGFLIRWKVLDSRKTSQKIISKSAWPLREQKITLNFRDGAKFGVGIFLYVILGKEGGGGIWDLGNLKSLKILTR